MKLIKPSEISARLLTLLDESDQKFVIVSPYIKISKWYKLRHKINGLKNRRIPLEIYVRDDPDNTATFRDLEQLELPYYKIPHLHSKLYLNERCGIVTSMNLLLSSEINSLEIGYVTESVKEYNDLFGFYHRYIHNREALHITAEEISPTMFSKEMILKIRNELDKKGRNSWIWLAGNTLHISTGKNNYIVSINDGNLIITASVRTTSGSGLNTRNHISFKEEVDYLDALIVKKVGDLTSMRFHIQVELNSDFIEIRGYLKHSLHSHCITEIVETDANYILDSITRFIDATNDL